MGQNLTLLLGIVLALLLGAAVAQVPAGCDCTDTPPDDEFTCEQQSDFGKCSEDWMTSGKLCEFTCGVCTCDDESEDAAAEESEEAASTDPEEGDEDRAKAEAEEAQDEGEDEADAEDETEASEIDAEEAEVDADEEEVNEDGPVVTLGDDEVVEEDEDAVAVDEADAEEAEEDVTLASDDPEGPATVGVILPGAAENDEANAEKDTPPIPEDDDSVVVAPALAEEVEIIIEDEAAVEEEEEADAEEEDETTSDESLEGFADPEATCDSTLYDALNTADETGAFATLLAAAALDADLGSEQGSFTVFAPTNEAVEDGAASLGISVDELISSPKGETIAKYHVVEGILEPVKLKQPKQIETVGGKPLIGGSVKEVESLGSTAKIIGDPIPICNSLVYLVDTVLLPASDLAGIAPVDLAPAPEDEAAKAALCEEGFDGFFAISEDEELSILTELLNTFKMSAGLADEATQYTIFAPTNDAFQKAAKALKITVDDLLKDENTASVLEYHIIDSILTGEDLLKEKSTQLKSHNGTDIILETNSRGTRAELFGVGSSALVTDTDIDKSCNAAVHKVNNVLLPSKAAESGTGVRGISSASKPATSPSSAPTPTKKSRRSSGKCQVGTQSLFEVLSQIPEIKVFSSIVRQAKLARVLTNKSLKVTVIAPLDYAFGNILPRGRGFFDLVPDVVLAENLVSMHIVGKPLPARLLKDGLKMKTALTDKGKPETLELVEDPLVFPTGLTIEAPESTANITKLDIFACNSVIHLVDAVLLADSEVIPSKTVTLTKALENSESFASLLKPRPDDDEGPNSG